MEERKEGQQEFFEGLEQSKKNVEKEGGLPVSPKRPIIAIPVENLVLSLIVVILVIVLFFSIGVERGKNIIHTKASKPKVYNELRKKLDIPKEEPKKVQETVEVPIKSEIKEELGKYTVQIVAYKDKDVAGKEIISLKQQGYSAFIIQEKGYFQICIGRYKTLEDAKKYSQKLRERYKDCYPRNIPN